MQAKCYIRGQGHDDSNKQAELRLELIGKMYI